MLWEKEDLLKKLRSNPAFADIFDQWTTLQQQEFINFCTGVRGIKFLYDGFSKEILNPEYTPERLNDFLSPLMKQKVKVHAILPNDSTRIADESSLLIMDIVVRLEDGSIANVECQRIGYKFPGQRAACYSADLLLRQYKRVKGNKDKSFSYKDIKKVYSIIFYEHSPKEFHAFPQHSIHRSKQKTDTGLEIELLQEFLFIPLDMAKEISHNSGIRNKLEAWFAFLSDDRPEKIIRLIEEYPEFRLLYEDVYDLCLNTEKVMGMFSKELQQIDRNTVQLMIDEMQEEIVGQKAQIDEQKVQIDEQKEQLAEKDASLAEKDAYIAELEAKLAGK